RAGARRLLRRDAPGPARLGGDAESAARPPRPGPAAARALPALDGLAGARRARVLLRLRVAGGAAAVAAHAQPPAADGVGNVPGLAHRDPARRVVGHAAR